MSEPRLQVVPSEREPALLVATEEETCGHEIGTNHSFVCCLQPGHVKHGIPHHYFGSVRTWPASSS